MLSFPNRAVLMSLILPLTVWVMPPFAQAVDSARVPVQKQTKAGLYVDAREAYELKRELGEKALFVDVRTRAE